MVHFHLSISRLVSLTCANNFILPLSRPESTLPQVLILGSLIFFRIRVYENIGGVQGSSGPNFPPHSRRNPSATFSRFG